MMKSLPDAESARFSQARRVPSRCYEDSLP